MKSFLISIIRKLLPKKVKSFLRKTMKFIQRYQYELQQKRYLKIVEKVKKKDKITVAFFLILESVWKCEYLYNLMVNHPRFEPIIIVCPVVNYGYKNMLSEMDKCYNFFLQKGYDVIRTYNVESDTYLNIRKEIAPDIVFYTNPYKGLIDDRYYISNFSDTLTCYVPYSSMVCSTPVQFNKPMQSLVWKFFIENSLIEGIIKKEAPNRGKNIIVTGSPALDIFFDKNYKSKNVWKHTQPKKIIWAPHHTILESEYIIRFSSFLHYADFMLEIAEKYSTEIQIAFKPHPLLHVKLLELWGEEKTNRYYEKWNLMENSQTTEGEYIDLFYTSDAMIFDSVSFITEYLYTQKASLFIYKKDIDEQLNEFGLKALSCHQKAQSKNDIINFIERIIAGEDDLKKEEKQLFYNKYLVPPHNQNAAKNILDYIQNQLDC
jgi:hypothetical protein